MKIGIIGTRGIPNLYGGFERFVELLVESPIWKDNDIQFVVYGESSGKYNPWTETKDIGILKNTKPLLYYFRSCVHASEDCDVILCCGVGLSFFSLWAILKGRTLVVNPDGCEWRRTKWSGLGRMIVRLMYWPALSAAKHIVIDAEALRNDFGRVLRNKAQYIAYQAPEPEIKELNISTRERLNIGKKYFLVIARIEPENNIGMIIKAFKEMSQSDVDLLIVGGTSTKYYTEVLQFEGGDNVRFLGSIYEQPILNELRGDCLAYVHGHSVGGTNPSLLEALASCGGALLCHDNQYNREVAGLEAQYFESVQKLSEQMTALTVPSRSSLRRIPTRDSRFKPETIAQQYLKLFEVIRAAG